MPRILTNQYIKLDPAFQRRDLEGIELDLGCGKGGFTLQLARKYPRRLILATDIMLGRLRRLERKVQRQKLHNVELLRTPVSDLLAWQLPTECVDRMHLLCPDPWPKARHRHKRLINAEFLKRAAQVLKTGGVLHFSSDDPHYFQHTLNLLKKLSWFEEFPEGIEDLRDLSSDFEKKWCQEGKHVPRLGWRKKPDLLC